MAIESPRHVDVFTALEQTYGLIDGSAGWADCLDALAQLAGFDACGLLLYDYGRSQSLLVEGRSHAVDAIDEVSKTAIDEFLWRSMPGKVWLNTAIENGDRPEWHPDHGPVWGYAIVDRDDAHSLYLEFLLQGNGQSIGDDTPYMLHRLLPHLHRACRLHRSIAGDPPLASLANWNVATPIAQAGIPIELRLRRRFRLSKAEARVAKLLADGLAPRVIAEKLNVSIHTVRSQLQSIFQKTETSRQAELTSLILRETEIPRALCETRLVDPSNHERSPCL